MRTQEDIEIPHKSRETVDQRKGWMFAAIAIAIGLVVSSILWFSISNKSQQSKEATEAQEGEPNRSSVELKKEEAALEIVTVTSAKPSSKFTVAGSVEPNQQQMQQISALANGRVESVNVALGDTVKPGMLLITIDSPQVAEMHGKLHEAETKLRLAKITLNRVTQAANRVNILKAKAGLDEASATLRRTKQLVSEGLVARKDLVSAESEFEKAQAEYNFQKDITLNREVSEAKADLSTAQTEAEHISDALRAIDAQLSTKAESKEHDISTLQLRSPIYGTVIERQVNPGAGVEAGKPLLTVANTSTLWVIANVPEREMMGIHIGTKASVILQNKTIAGTVSFIDPRLNEDTRTSRVRIIIENPNKRIQAGAFAQIEFDRPVKQADAIFIPSAAVQTVEGRQVVFVQDSDGKFSVRDVKAGQEVEGTIPVDKGISPGEKIAANGSFVLKSKLLKDQLGGED
jgi:membrane fusion protein, heavy metal efflux system